MKHKGTVITVIVAILLLIAAFFMGGGDKKGGDDTGNTPSVSVSASPSETAPSSEPSAEASPSGTAGSDASEAPTQSPDVSGSAAIGASKSVSGSTQGATDAAPAPSAPQITAESGTQMTCTLSISCAALQNNMSLLSKSKQDIVPKDGVIFASKKVSFNAGESVFNVLSREMKKAGIQMEFKNTPMYGSAYIESIDNLYEFDAGNLSGWVYEVNGVFPNYGCSRYQLKDGDSIVWHYTCDLGKDVGGNNSEG